MRLKVFGCSHPEHADTTLEECNRPCPHRMLTPPVIWPIRFDHANLGPELPGKRFNASLIEHGDGYALAWRHGWAGSEVYVSLLDAGFRPTGVHKRLAVRRELYGAEDPRLFLFNDRLHVMFIGVVSKPIGRRKRQRVSHTDVRYAALTEDFAVQDGRVFFPHYAARNKWEKNWGFFEHDGQLFAVYSIAPHRILRIDGDKAELAFETPIAIPWTWGEARGGAPPVRVGDQFYSWFHGRQIGKNGKQQYATGVYTFAAEPPFRILRMTPEPIVTADPETNTDNYADVTFVCGAINKDDEWIVSSGEHDRFTLLRRFTHAEVEARLVPVP